jgi:C1A family cysteine protease
MLAALAALAADPTDIASDPLYSRFEHFIQKHRGGQPYKDEIETIARFTVFKQTIAHITKLNADNARTETHGITQFADLTKDEFRAKFKGLTPASETLKKKMPYRDHGVHQNYTAASIDWNDLGAVTPIKNQGQCGSCWAFSATEQLESDYFLSYGTLKELSPQQLTSCDTLDAGCGGGNPINAWSYVNSFGGQESAASYPYTSGTTTQSGSCKSNAKLVQEDVTSALGYMISSSPSQEANMLKQIEVGPMSVTVDAELWQTYTGGIITSSSGCGTSIDHAVQAVGYNAPGNYWIVRNSWGANFGEAGNVYVQYGANVCGITSQATITAPAKIA